MTQDEILTCLGQSAEAPQLLEEHSTYTDDAGRRLPAPPGESFFEALPKSISSLLAYYPDRALRTQQLLALLSLLGSVAIHCRVAHDNRQYGTTLMVLIYGSPASGKGRIAELLPLVQGIDRKVQDDSHREIRRAERQLEVQRLKRQRMAKSREVTDSEIERNDLMPHSFTTADAIEAGKQRGISERTTKRRMKAWEKAQFISKLERGKYSKCTENTMEEVPNGTSHT